MSQKSNLHQFKRPQRPNEYKTEDVLAEIFRAQAADDIFYITGLAMQEFSDKPSLSVQAYAEALIGLKGQLSKTPTRAGAPDTGIIYAYALGGEKHAMKEAASTYLAAAQKAIIQKGEAGYNIATAFAMAADTRPIICYMAEEWITDPETMSELLYAAPALAVGDDLCLDIKRPELIYEAMGLNLDTIGGDLRLSVEEKLGVKLPDYIRKDVPKANPRYEDGENNLLQFKRT